MTYTFFLHCGAVAQSVRRVASREVMGSIPAVAPWFLLFGSVSVCLLSYPMRVTGPLAET